MSGFDDKLRRIIKGQEFDGGVNGVVKGVEVWSSGGMVLINGVLVEGNACGKPVDNSKEEENG